MSGSEDRGPPRCTLLVYVDDATSRLMELRFVRSESTFDYFAATDRYLRRHGQPVAFYSDNGSPTSDGENHQHPKRHLGWCRSRAPCNDPVAQRDGARGARVANEI